MYAFDRGTGVPRWKHDLKYGVGTMLMEGSNIYAVDFEMRLLAIHVNTGKLVHKIEGVSNQSFLFPPSPVNHHEVVFHARSDGRLQALRTGNHKRIWERQMPEQITSDLATDSKGLFLATEGKLIHELDPKTGKTVRTFQRDGVVRWRILAASNRLMFLEWNQNTASGLECLDLITGKESWSQQAPEGSEWDTFRPLLWKDLILIGSNKGYVAAFDVMTGSLAWSFHLEGNVRSLSASEHLIYAGSINGTLSAILPPD